MDVTTQAQTTPLRLLCADMIHSSATLQCPLREVGVDSLLNIVNNETFRTFMAQVMVDNLVVPIIVNTPPLLKLIFSGCEVADCLRCAPMNGDAERDLSKLDEVDAPTLILFYCAIIAIRMSGGETVLHKKQEPSALKAVALDIAVKLLTAARQMFIESGLAKHVLDPLFDCNVLDESAHKQFCEGLSQAHSNSIFVQLTLTYIQMLESTVLEAMIKEARLPDGELVGKMRGAIGQDTYYAVLVKDGGEPNFSTLSVDNYKLLCKTVYKERLDGLDQTRPLKIPAQKFPPMLRDFKPDSVKDAIVDPDFWPAYLHYIRYLQLTSGV